MRSKCENPERIDTGQPCTKPAVWTVRIGTRETDRQHTCAECLPYVADIMYTTENRVQTHVTLERLHDR